MYINYPVYFNNEVDYLNRMICIKETYLHVMSQMNWYKNNRCVFQQKKKNITKTQIYAQLFINEL